MTRQPQEQVTLTRKQIAQILEEWMGWEPIDTRSFWRLAKQESAEPGLLENKMRVITVRTSARIRRAFAKYPND